MTRALNDFFAEIGHFAQMFWDVLRWTPRRPWDFGELLNQMVRVGVLSLPVVLLTALFTGAVMALQTYGVLARVNAESFTGSIIALSMVRELAAVLAALMIAGRCGSAMGAELGTMRVTQQIDALEVLATNPVHYLVVPRVWATTIVLPLLVVLSNVVGIYGGYLVSVVLMGANPVSYIDRSFQFMELADVTSGLIKAAVFGFIIALIGCLKGYRTRGGAKGVGNSTTKAVVAASISVLIVDFFLTKILF
ncbi:MAG: ABC transporter permease [Acidobacteria bacterium]|nr:MAG: ABC transporter permease [Acidobacteriota bacterium]REK08369.1 MAG: ABC transporter permease [Acidobacteriota bacterium]